MLEVHVRTDQGWVPLSCSCPAGRAVFSSESGALEAINAHRAKCSSGGNAGSAARDDLPGAFRVFAVEAIPT
ncbi:MAG: hypothetical protein ACKVT1_18760 [Dehalococcoidia bacterium]